jgi:hypothetical protein
MRTVNAALQPETGRAAERRAAFNAIMDAFLLGTDPIQQQMGGTMHRFEPGLFAGGDDLDLPDDNLGLERWFKGPKGHERRIHGHAHAGVRIVQEGPSLLPALDAHLLHPTLFASEELIPYMDAVPPACQHNAIHRRKVMRRARSSKRRHLLLAELERRYLNSS